MQWAKSGTIKGMATIMIQQKCKTVPGGIGVV